MKFEEFNLDQNLLKGITEAGYSECLPVQVETLTHTLKGKEVAVQSQTGTGKTAAFLISIFQDFITDENIKTRRAMIIVPTRELAVQIEDEAKLLAKHIDVSIGSFYGGVGYVQQEKMLRNGVNIIIGTPGRIIDFNESGKLDFKILDTLVIDEADRLFDMGFYPDISKIVKRMGKKEDRRIMLFSATLSDRVRHLAGQYMNDPVEIEVESQQMTVDNISQKLYHVGSDEKINLLLGILHREKPRNALIFTNTKRMAVELSDRLYNNGYQSQYIIGDLPQKKRLQVIEGLKNGTIRYLVATDVAARGLHVDDLELVVNYDLPEDCENYVHRIGRTARAGKSGNAISLVCERFVFGLESIQSFIDMDIPVQAPDEDLFIKDQSRGKRRPSEADRPRFENKRGSGRTAGRSGRPARSPERTERTAQRSAKSGPRRPERTGQQAERKPAERRQRPAQKPAPVHAQQPAAR
ncbi:MAG TPA: DEAD/DEAH box helicase, partial [Spirochaetota bacterium]|nr:DEAD/DEAH box helicase [Spirochaetota bacterium]